MKSGTVATRKFWIQTRPTLKVAQWPPEKMAQWQPENLALYHQNDWHYISGITGTMASGLSIIILLTPFINVQRTF
jgi:hypothetical protein